MFPNANKLREYSSLSARGCCVVITQNSPVLFTRICSAVSWEKYWLDLGTYIIENCSCGWLGMKKIFMYFKWPTWCSPMRKFCFLFLMFCFFVSHFKPHICGEFTLKDQRAISILFLPMASSCNKNGRKHKKRLVVGQIVPVCTMMIESA